MAGQLIDSKSTPTSKSEIDFFSVPSTQIAVEKSSWFVVNPQNTVTNAGPYEFHLPAEPHFLDLSKNYIHLKLRIKNANNTNIGAADVVGPINLLGKTFFKQVKLFLGSKLVYDSGDLYAYRAFLETELNYSQDQKSAFLTATGYYLDKPPDHIDDNQNTGWQARCLPYANSGVVELMAPLHLDLAHQEKYLINGMDLRLELHRHDAPFALTSYDAGADFMIVVEDIRWMVRKVDLAKPIMMAIESTLMRNVVRYPIRRVQVKAIELSAGRRDTPINTVFSGQLPRRLIIGVVSSPAYRGNYRLGPFNFQHFNASSIQVCAGGENYPPIPINMHYANDIYVEPFVHFHEALGCAGSDKTPWISYDEYKQGHCLYSFDLTPDNADTGHWELLKEGTTSIHIHFRADIPAGGAKLIVLAEFDNLMTIDRFRNVHYDFTP